MTTECAIKSILASIDNTSLFVCSLGRTAELAFRYIPNTDRILFLDCLGAPIGVGTGVALANSDSSVFSFETDGSFFYNMSVLNTLKKCEKKLHNYYPIIFDNELLESGGGLASASSGIFNWVSLANAWGLSLFIATDENEVHQYFANRQERGLLSLLVLKINNISVPNNCTKDIDGIESRYRFKRFINNNIRKGIIKPCTKN
jgi:thiamine pyrophosphate-dependent acetolactate synthase large subunit-like protein